MGEFSDYREPIVAVVVAILSWIVKNHFVGYMAKREEAAKNEWEFRLRNVWNPLFFWSGVVLFEPSKKDLEDPKGSYGIKELSSVLQQAAHLIPLEHYRTFVRLLEIRTGQKNFELDLQKLKRARAYVYGQIETYNYILFGRYPWFRATRHTDPLGSIRESLRFFGELLWHFLIWGILVVLLLALVAAVSDGGISSVVSACAGVFLLLVLYLYWRFRAHRAVTVRQTLGRAAPTAIPTPPKRPPAKVG